MRYVHLTITILAELSATMPIAIDYTLWSGIGTSPVAVLSWLIWRQPIEFCQIAGILLIIAGRAVLHLGPQGVHLPGCD